MGAPLDLALLDKAPGPGMITLQKDAAGRYFVSFSSGIESASLSLPAEEARNGHRERACQEQASSR